MSTEAEQSNPTPAAEPRPSVPERLRSPRGRVGLWTAGIVLTAVVFGGTGFAVGAGVEHGRGGDRQQNVGPWRSGQHPGELGRNRRGQDGGGVPDRGDSGPG